MGGKAKPSLCCHLPHGAIYAQGHRQDQERPPGLEKQWWPWEMQESESRGAERSGAVISQAPQLSFRSYPMHSTT